MTWVRVVWIVLSLAAVGLAVDTASWALLQVTDCELGLGPVSPTECPRPLHEIYGLQLVPILAIPVLLCLIPVFRPHRWVAWSVAAALFAATVVGFLALASSPLIATLGGTWLLLPFVILASIAHPLMQRKS